MTRTIIFGVLALLCSISAAQAQINPIPLIIQNESGGNPTAVSNVPGSHASGLFQDQPGTWAEALQLCGSACGTLSQYPTAASAPASIQIAANSALINQNGLSDWTCPNCDPALVAAINSAGGLSMFQTSGLDSNPVDYANADSNLAGFLTDLSNGTSIAGNGFGNNTAGTAAAGGGNLAGSVGATSGNTTVTNLPGTGTGAGSAVLDNIETVFQQQTQGWQAALLSIATDLFWLLATIDLVAALIMLVIGGGRPDWSDVVFTIMRWLFPVGLFLWLMNNGTTYAQAIIDSLRQAGQAIGGTAISPSGIFWAGVNIVTTITNNMHGFLDAIHEIPVIIAAIPMIIAFAYAACLMLMTLVESYFVVGLAVLFLAFGGMRWTRGIAITLLMSCVAVGFKLLAIAVIAGLGTNLVTQWAQNAAGLQWQGIFIMIGAAFAFAALVKIVPERLERIVAGYTSALAHPSQFRREAETTAALGVGAIAASVGSIALAVQAIKHAIEQQTQSSQSGSTAARILQLGAGAASAVGSAAGAELGARLGGMARGGAGASIVRMAGRVAQTRQVAAAERGRPQPPPASE